LPVLGRDLLAAQHVAELKAVRARVIREPFAAARAFGDGGDRGREGARRAVSPHPAYFTNIVRCRAAASKVERSVASHSTTKGRSWPSFASSHFFAMAVSDSIPARPWATGPAPDAPHAARSAENPSRAERATAARSGLRAVGFERLQARAHEPHRGED